MTSPAKVKRRPATALPDFWWISGPSYKKVREDMIEAGEDGRLEVYPKNGKVSFKVVSPTYDGPLTDDSHSCPIDCP